MPTTTNYEWTTPTVGGSTDTWGTELNAAFEAIDGDLKAVADAAQPVDADLTAIAALAKTDGNFIVGNGTTWVAESGATARTSMGAYGAGSNASFGTIAATGAVTFSAGGTLGDASGDVVIIKGTTVHATSASFLGGSSASAWRANLQLGSMATQNSNAVSITGGSATGLTSVSATTVTGTSDRRLKKKIKKLGSVSERAQRLRPVTFEWKTGLLGRRMGLVAQELQEEFPELVIESGGRLHIDIVGLATLALSVALEAKRDASR